MTLQPIVRAHRRSLMAAQFGDLLAALGKAHEQEVAALELRIAEMTSQLATGLPEVLAATPAERYRRCLIRASVFCDS